MAVRIVIALMFTASLAACAGAPQAVPQQTAARVIAAPPITTAADFVLVEKAARRLTVFSQGAVLKTYGGLQFGDAPRGHKQFEGDERTPEGRYLIDYRNSASAYHLSLHISYPNGADRAYARAHGRSPGGAIFIHGQPNGLAEGRMAGDWTDGCIALSNGEMSELWASIADGTPIEIRP